MIWIHFLANRTDETISVQNYDPEISIELADRSHNDVFRIVLKQGL